MEKSTKVLYGSIVQSRVLTASANAAAGSVVVRAYALTAGAEGSADRAAARAYALTISADGAASTAAVQANALTARSDARSAGTPARGFNNNKLLVLRLGLALLRALDVVEALEGGGVWVGAAEGVEDEGEDVRGELGADGDVVAPGDGVALREEGEVRAGRWRAAVEGRVGVHGDLERVEALDGVAEGEDGGELRAELAGLRNSLASTIGTPR